MGVIYYSFILMFFGFLPSIIWLAFYLRKDCHPEPGYLISRVFLMGIVLAPLAVIAQWLFGKFAGQLFPGFQVANSAVFFLWSALVEEAVKLLTVKFIVLNNPEFDEPVDAMIYMITAALGFAAIENILVIVQSIPQGAQLTIQLWILRFAGATLLHAVASAIMGYFLALSWFYHKHQGKFIIIGLMLATIIHFAFNFLLLTLNGEPTALIYSFAFLVITAGFVSILFQKVRDRGILSTT